MPLYDSFKKPPRAPDLPARAKHLGSAPTIDDLRGSLLAAQGTLRQPVVLTWRREGTGPMFLLTVIRSQEGLDPAWSYHIDDSNNVSLIWSYTTSDPELIFSLVTEQLKEEGPSAVIPESLRPKPGSEQSLSSPDRSQPQFFEQYEILNTIGRGGMGIIYKAVDRADGAFVALKVLKADLMIDPSCVERFKHEASAVHKLSHPNLISLREFGVSRFGQPFLAMDFLQGIELAKYLEKHRQLELPVFASVFAQTCEALAYAHEKGLVHRDLKPGNLMLVPGQGGDVLVKIIDFGIAKSIGEPRPDGKPGVITTGNSPITTTGTAFVGSPAYMSPEQCAGGMLDSRSDIYSLGIVMYESLTGLLPFRDTNVLKVIFMHVNDTPPSFSTVRPDLNLPEALERIVFKSLEKDPRDRYQTAQELREDLMALAALGFNKPTKTRPLAALPKKPPPPADPASLGRTLQQNPLSDRAFSLLRWAGILSDDLVQVVRDCEHMLESGEISAEQAIAIIKHAQQQEKEETAGP